MKWSEAIANVDKSASDRFWVDTEEFCQALDLSLLIPWNCKVDQRMKGYGLVTWLCTDTMVGAVAWYLDEELVAISYKNARRTDISIEFLNETSAEKVKKFLLEIAESTAVIKYADLESEIPNT